MSEQRSEIDFKKDVLTTVRNKIGTPERWTKGTGARNAVGTPVNSAGPEACQWCVVGAFWSVGTIPYEVLRLQVPEPFADLAEFNDHPDTTHADIMALFDRAIDSLT